jgi:hypothetical protein
MRDLYGSRIAALLDDARQHLGGLLAISDVKAGLYTVGVLENGMSSRQAETAAATRGVEVLALDRYTLKRRDRKGLLLGFAAFDEAAIRSAVVQLAAALSQPRAGATRNAGSPHYALHEPVPEVKFVGLRTLRLEERVRCGRVASEPAVIRPVRRNQYRPPENLLIGWRSHPGRGFNLSTMCLL